MANQTGSSEIEAAGAAFKMAQKWLRQKGMQPDMAVQASEDAVLDKPRTPGMGLGAAYLPHHKGKAAAASLDKHLVRRMSASSQHHGPTSTLSQKPSVPEHSSDEEEAGRGSAFGSKAKALQVRHEEYAIQPTLGVHKKKKKKKKNKKLHDMQP